MLLKEFPDISWLKNAIARDFDMKRSWDNRILPHAGWPTAILNVKTNLAERKDIRGPFSLFMNISGHSRVTCDHKTVKISSDTYVLSNNGQPYDLIIDEKQSIETFNIHFGEKLFTDTFHVLTGSNRHLLDNISATTESFNLPIRSSFRDEVFNSLVREVKLNYENEENEHTLHALLSHLLTSSSEQLQRIENINSLKSSTKEELIRRIYLGVDFMHSHFNEAITLDQIAQAAMMSKFHFLRVFKSVFGISPHQYIKQIRIQKATDLIRKNNLPLYLIAQSVGIENGSSLSRMMYQTTGKRPSDVVTN